MYCPVCSVMSSVVKQDDAMTKEGAIQLDIDRMLAEKLQKMEYDEQDRNNTVANKSNDKNTSYPMGFLRSTKTTGGSELTSSLMQNSMDYPNAKHNAIVPTKAPSTIKSWWDDLSSVISVGVSNKKGNSSRPADIKVSPPPCLIYPSQRFYNLASTDMEDNRQEEHQDLLYNSNRSHVASARHLAKVAEHQPLFSCLVNTVSTTANIIGTAFMMNTIRDDDDGNAHGVDTSSLLAVTNVGRD